MRSPLSILKSYAAWYGHPYWATMLSAKVVGRPSIIKVRPPRIAHPVFLRPKTTDLPMYHQVFTRRQYAVALDRAPETIVDCGGNAGYTSVYLANAYSKARIVSVEPALSNYCLLTRNVAPYPNVMPINAAVWKRNTMLDVGDERAEACSFRTEEHWSGPQSQVSGKAIGLTIDTILDLAGMQEVDFLKLDIEGAEHELFVDPTRWLDRVNVLAIEIHDSTKPGCTSRIREKAATRFNFECQNGEIAFFAKSAFVGSAVQSDGWQPIGGKA
jgi:FkbM family methyltransferase